VIAGAGRATTIVSDPFGGDVPRGKFPRGKFSLCFGGVSPWGVFLGVSFSSCFGKKLTPRKLTPRKRPWGAISRLLSPRARG